MMITLLVSVLLLSTALGDTYHIVVSQNLTKLNDSCLMLSELAENVSNYLGFNSEVKFVLQQGNHILLSEIVIRNASNLSITGSGTSVLVKCQRQGKLLFESIGYIEVSNLIFDSCRGHQISLVLQFVLRDCIYRTHIETALKVNNSSCNITNTSFLSNSAGYSHGSKGGGAMIVVESSIMIENCTFRDNSAERGGAIFAEIRSSVNIFDSEFIDNHIRTESSECFGGALYIISSNLSAINCEFHNNSAHNGYYSHYANGGVIAVIRGNFSIQECFFAFNKATDGGVVFSQSSCIYINASIFTNNSATHIGAVLHLDNRSKITADNTMFTNNKAELGIIYLVESSCIFQGHTEISDNIGSLLMYYSNATFKGNTNFISNNMPNISTHFHKGGAITAIRSSVSFQGQSNLSHNTADNGGAIHAIASKLYVHIGTHIISNNSASESGGGIYLFLSEFKCEYNCKIVILGNSAGKGGGVYSIASILTTVYGSQINFSLNTASMHGGGIYLEVSAKLNILIVHARESTKLDEINLKPESSKHSLLFINNSAGEYGGAVYVADETDSGTCNTTKAYSSASECFLQAIILSNSGIIENDVVTIKSPSAKFLNNRALYHGNNLFGGLLDRCTLSPFADGRGESKQFNITNSFTYFQFLSNISDLNSISSQPVRVCFCRDSNLKPDCSYQPPPYSIQRGETVTVSLAAVDQANHSVKAKIHGFLSPSEGGSLGGGQSIQNTTQSCTNLSFTVASPNDIIELVVYAGGPCKDAVPSRSKIQFNFTRCMCLIGFQINLMETTRCVYECDSKLTKYGVIARDRCDYQTKTLEKVTNSWIGYDNNNYDFSFSGYSYLIHFHCPREYCNSSYVNLSILDGTDAQCRSHRSGVLCGRCQVNFSISLGSSNCITCPNYWPVQFIAISILFFLSGILLVTILLALNLTVAVGTLNGIMFYANIVDVNKGTFFEFSTPNFVTVFISWLNLDFGFDVCFIKNLNAYWKSWLQLLFPTYVIFLVIMVIIVSQRSRKFSQLIGKKNPVATLATLIFLSYAKFLNVIIVALSCTTLIYSGPDDGEHHNMPLLWLSDPSVRCFRGHHLILFIAAIFILIVGIAYTVLLFTWQWLLCLYDKFCSSWTRVWVLKLSMFIEPYHAPYTPKHRYWTGLLLLVRVLLYIASAVNVSDDPRIDLLIVGIVLICILLVKEIISVSGRVYKKWPIEILEVSCYVNLILLCFTTLFELQNERFKACIVYTSVSITIVLFIGVLLYHIFTEVIFKTKLWNRMIKSHLISLQYCLKSVMENKDTELQERCTNTGSLMANERERSTSIFTRSDANELPYFNMDSEPTY